MAFSVQSFFNLVLANFFFLSVLSSIKELILLVVVAVVVERGEDGVTSVQIAVLVVAVLGGRICQPVLPVGGIAVLDVNAGRVAGAVLGGVVVVLLQVFDSSGGIVLSGGKGNCTRITC